MKKMIVLIGVLFSVSAMATDFTAKLDKVDCTIKNNIVTRTQTIGKDTSASFTETKEVKLSGIEALVDKAAETSTDIPSGAGLGFVYSMNHKGKIFNLNMNDSDESLTLIQLIGRVCR